MVEVVKAAVTRHPRSCNYYKAMTSYVVLQWLALFGQISLHWQLRSLSVGRRLPGVWGVLYAQIFSEFYLFYFIFYKVKHASHSNTTHMSHDFLDLSGN